MAKNKLLKDDIAEKDLDLYIKNTNESLIKLRNNLLELKKTASTLGSSLKNISFQQNMSPADVEKINRAYEKQLEIKKKINQASVDATLIQSERKKAIELEKAAKKEKEYVDALKLEGKTIEELQKKNNALILSRKRLDLTTSSGLTQYKGLTAEIARNQTKLKDFDKQIGVYNRNVGNYFGAVKNFLGAAGIGIGIDVAFTAIKNLVGGSIKAFREFEKSMSELKAITGASAKDLMFFGNAAKELSSKSTVAATDVVKAFSLIGSAKPELLKSASALTEVTDKAIVLSEAAGMSLPDAAAALTDSMNQFGAPADQAGRYINTLAAGAKEGAASITMSKDALLGFGSVASGANVNIEESVALIQTLADKGIKGAEAGTALRNVLLKLSAPDALPKDAQDMMKKLGVNMEIVADKSLPINVRLKEMSKVMNDTTAMTKIFGAENITAGNILLQNIPRFEQLTKSVTGTSEAYKQQADMTDNLDGKLKKLDNAQQNMKITLGETFAEMLDDMGILEGMTSALNRQADVLNNKSIPAYQRLGLVMGEYFSPIGGQLNEAILKMRGVGERMASDSKTAVDLATQAIKLQQEYAKSGDITKLEASEKAKKDLQNYLVLKNSEYGLNAKNLELLTKRILIEAQNRIQLEQSTNALEKNTDATEKNNAAKGGKGTTKMDLGPLTTMPTANVTNIPIVQDLTIDPQIREILPLDDEDKGRLQELNRQIYEESLALGSEFADFYFEQKQAEIDADIEQTESEIENSNARIDQLNNELDEKKQALAKELELGATGAANNADQIRKEIALKEQEIAAEKNKKAQLEVERKKEEAEKKKVGEQQKKVAIANLTVDLFQELGKIGWFSAANPLNIITSGGAGAAQYAILSALALGRYGLGIAQIKAQKYAKGGTGILEGERHINGGVNLGAIGEGEQGERFSIFSREATRKHGSVIEEFTNAANANKLQDWIINTGFDKSFIANHYIDMTNKEIENRISKMVEQQVLTNYYLKNQKTVLNNGKLIINSDNSREVFVG